MQEKTIYRNSYLQCHSRPQRSRSFWSAPRIVTSGQVQHRKSAIHGLSVTLRMLRVKPDKSGWFWSQSIVSTKSFKPECPWTGSADQKERGQPSWVTVHAQFYQMKFMAPKYHSLDAIIIRKVPLVQKQVIVLIVISSSNFLFSTFPAMQHEICFSLFDTFSHLRSLKQCVLWSHYTTRTATCFVRSAKLSPVRRG